MARVIEYAVQSDLSGEEIPKGQRVIVRFEYETEGSPNYVADLTAEEADALREHTHARTVTARVRKTVEQKAADAKAAAEAAAKAVEDAKKEATKK